MRELPFSNLLEYTKYFVNLKNNILELKNFTSNQVIEIKGVSFDYFDFFMAITFDYTFGNNNCNKDLWLSFDTDELKELLKDDFFHEYKTTNQIMRNRVFPFLEVYIYYKLQSISTNYLTYEETGLIALNWLFNDKIEDIYSLGWYEIISNVYKNFGVHWFCDRDNDPILYKFAYYAIMSCKKCGTFPPEKIKQDLMQLYSELLISFAVRNTTQENMDIIDLVKNSVVNFDDEELVKLTSAISSLQKEKFDLIDENKQLNEGLSILKRQISELQKSDVHDNEKIERIVFQIYCLSPQTAEYENKYENFKSIWEKLSDSTKKDIKQSISMFEQYDSIDLAIFPLLRSLEHEFIKNFIEPFHQSCIYLQFSEFICSDKKYELTHKCLIKNGNQYPTIGSIPYIGRCLDNEEALNSSNLLNGFSNFLENNKKSFCNICKNIDTYSIGSKKLRLVNIRNGIAHGDLELTESIDKQCYTDITTMLYEPPVRILFEIIENSKLGD